MASVELDGQYRALREEAGAARLARGVLDVAGPDAVEYLQSQLTNDIEATEEGSGCYSALLDRKGHMQSDMRVLRTASDRILVELERPALPTVLRHLTMYSVGRDVAVAETTLTALALAGPVAHERSGAGPLAREHDHRSFTLDGHSVRGVRSALGVDLLVEADAADAVLAALADAGVATVEEDALEILRVEAGRPRFGLEMTSATIPQEAGINDRAVSFTKGCYIGQETVARLHYKGRPNRHLRGLRLHAPVEAGATVRLGERELGRVGTAVLSPALGPIALAILRREAEPGATVSVDGGVEAEIVELPFV